MTDRPGTPGEAVPKHRRPYRLLLLIPLAALAVAFAPEGRLRCDEPWVRVPSPDGAWALELCRVPMLFAMPGGSGDAPGWIVLRDAEGAIRGVSWLGMVQEYGASGPAEWGRRRVSVPLVAELPLAPASGPLARWWDDRIWRLRALLGVVPTDEDFH
ncbi:hypothetical protein [Roseomonas populi]|uniref:Uncharacterized protein n=1 Tax=Roseomonas populi TaxID=3121582 RepID=A0ABT1X1D1_9PROT|nr:hypothetical protein [Roseomonas pecuniae]MCR0981906.1 hypothetical protein [Roseomonas pecuniae]